MAQKKKRISIETAKEAIAHFIGRGKVLMLEDAPVEEVLDPKSKLIGYRVHFRENGQFKNVVFENKREAVEFMTEFGGKNTLTVSIPNKYLTIDGYNSTELYDAGHIVIQITLGSAQYRFEDENTNPVDHELPIECGLAFLPRSKRIAKNRNDNVILRQEIKTTNHIGKKVVVTPQQETVENLSKYLGKKFPNHIFHIDSFHTKNHETGDICFFQRKKVGDGTKAMEMRLQKLNGKDYSECRFKNILQATDGLAIGECEKVTIDYKPPPKTEEHCAISLGV